MAEHPIEGMMGVTMEKIRQLVDANTIIGEPITVDGATIIPISRVTFGFASGGSDVGAKTNKQMFGGGTGAGVSIAPIAFFGDQRRQCAHHPAGGTCQPGGQRYQRSAGPCGPHQRPNQKGQARNPAGISGQISFFPNRNPAQSGLFN